MNVCLSLLHIAELWGLAYLITQVAHRGPLRVVPAAVVNLAALGVLSLLAFAACAIGFQPVEPPAYLEALKWQPALNIVPCVGVAGVMAWLRQSVRPWVARGRMGLDLPTGLLLLLGATLYLWTLLPPFLIDESLYHLTLPVQYLRHGKLTVIAGHGNSSFPAFGEMLAFWGLAAETISGARAVGWLTAVLGTRAVAVLLPRREALWGCVAFAVTPVVFCILPTSHIDVLEAVFEVVGVLCLARYKAHDEPGFLWIAAWLIGCGAASKFLALAVIPFAALAVLLILQRWQSTGRPLPPLSHLAFAAVLVATPVAPWLVRNALVWGNPLFPFLLDLFPASAGAITDEARNTLEFFMRQFGPAYPDGSQMFGIEALLHLPWALFFEAKFDTVVFDGVIGPFALWICLLALALRLKPAWRLADAPKSPPILLWYAIFRLAVWLSTSWQMRFIVPPYLALCLLAPGVLSAIRDRFARTMALAVAVTSLAVCAPVIFRKMPPLDRRMLGTASDMHALRLERKAHSAPCDFLSSLAADAQRAHLPTPKAIMVWTQEISLWCDVDLYSDSYDEASTFNGWLEKGVEPALSGMRAMGVTHVVINEASFFAMPPTGVGAEEAARLDRVFKNYATLKDKYLHALSRGGDVVLYAL